MSDKNSDRRSFLQDVALRFATWSPVMALAGFRFCPYVSRIPEWRGWIEWCGRTVGFVARNGKITWMSQLR